MNIPLSPDIFFTLHIIGVFALSLILYDLFIYFSYSFGIREFQKQEQNRWNPNYKPSLGGFVFYIIFLLIMIFSSIWIGLNPNEKHTVLGIWGSATVAFFMGFADDTFNTQPIFKLSSQILCAYILVLTGTHINLFQSNILNYFLTIFWVVGIMNSINMLDNMDGIAASVSLYILSFIAILMWRLNINILSIDFLIISGISVGLVSFLIFNFYPSRIFMGDTGSQFLGILLAYSGIRYLWNLPSSHIPIHPIWFHFILIAIVYLILLIDTTTVTINRLMAGGSPFVGGKDHTTHFLCKRGLSERTTFFVLLIISVLSLFIAYQYVFNFSYIWMYIAISYIVISFLILYLNTKIPCSEKH